MPVPDLLAVSLEKAREALERDSWLEGSPDLVIEVVSPHNRRLERKPDIYLAGGAKQVWLVHPKRKTITVFAPAENSLVEYRQGETIGFEGVMVPVSRVFHPQTLLV